MCSVVEVFDAIHSRLFWVQLMIDKDNCSITMHLHIDYQDDMGKCIFWEGGRSFIFSDKLHSKVHRYQPSMISDSIAKGALQ